MSSLVLAQVSHNPWYHLGEWIGRGVLVLLVVGIVAEIFKRFGKGQE